MDECTREPALPSRETSVSADTDAQSAQPPTGAGSDQAALIGAAFAAVIALILGEGPYTVFDVVVGSALGAALLGYYRPSPTTGHDRCAKASAFAAVVALLFSLSVAWPLQWMLNRGQAGVACHEDLLEVAELAQELRLVDARPTRDVSRATWARFVAGETPSTALLYALPYQKQEYDACVAAKATIASAKIYAALLVPAGVLGYKFVLRERSPDDRAAQAPRRSAD